MDSRSTFFAIVAATALVCVSSRAVNISNTWMLPEEGFPVFYRYFRDRISWYEADAVCQFHHANLVTVDSTSEYDAVRAYLKELDIINNVWIGLSKTTEKSHFTWTDFRPLSNDGHWQEAIPVGSTPLCAATDPAADFRWHALSCGGSEVASFICELTVPSWAAGPKGCLLTELPSLTVLYVPEQSAIELTSDCGLDGTKRIACKGNSDRDEMMQQLSCSITNDDYDDKTTKGSFSENTISDVTNPSQTPNIKTTKPWIYTSNTISTGDFGTPTRHRRETENTLNPPSSTQSTAELNMQRRTATSRGATTISSKPITSASTQEVETVTSSNSNDITLDLSVTPKSNISEITSSSAFYLTTQKSTNQPEEQSEAYSNSVSVATSKSVESIQEDNGEYSGVINQGQLFSIIENGTMFDIIELNETGTEETKESGFTLSQDSFKTNSEIESTTRHTQTPKALYTTVIYHKEPPEDIIIKKSQNVEQKQLKQDVTPTFKIYESKISFNDKNAGKRKSLNDLLTKDDDKTLTKEIEMFPIVSDTSIKLNRTYRKKLPMIETNLTKENEDDLSEEVDDLITADETSNHRVVEIKLHTDDNKNNIKAKLFVTTKFTKSKLKGDKNEKIINNNEKNKIEVKKDTIEKFDDEHLNYAEKELGETGDEIDPKIDELNTKMINTTKNVDSEIISPMPFQETNLKNQLLPKSLIEDPDFTKSPEVIINDYQEVSSTLDNPTKNPSEVGPQQPQRPNRQRLLTKPQRRSFYPYFFSRVLG